ncbi:MAG: dephospho-CoA kinase [Bdellovibrionota bacterium]
MKWVGLTGGIATGKSTAARLIEGLGVQVIDADLISHKLSEVGATGYEKILSHFGKNILNSDLSIDRKELGRLIFSSPSLKSDLEGILHPLIRNEVQKQKKQYEQQGAKLCFYDVPLLFEKKSEADFDATVLVWCDSQAQLNRLLQRNQLGIEEASLRIKNQLPMLDKIKMADYCLDNSGDTADLEKQIKKLLKTLLKTQEFNI